MDYGIATVPPPQPLQAIGYWTAQDLFGVILDTGARFGWPEGQIDEALAVADYAPELAARALQLETDTAAANKLWKLAPPVMRARVQALALAVADGLIRETAEYYAAHPDEKAAADAQRDAAARAKWGNLPGEWSGESFEDVQRKLDARDAERSWVKWAKVGAAVATGLITLKILRG